MNQDRSRYRLIAVRERELNFTLTQLINLSAACIDGEKSSMEAQFHTCTLSLSGHPVND